MNNRVTHCPICGRDGLEIAPPEMGQVSFMVEKQLIGFTLSCSICGHEVPCFATIGTLHTFLVKLCTEHDLYRSEFKDAVWVPPLTVVDHSEVLNRLKPQLIGLFDVIMARFWGYDVSARQRYVANSPALRALMGSALKTLVDDVGSDHVVVTRDVFNIEYHFTQVHVGQSLAN